MNEFTIITTTVGALAVAALGFTGVAAAAPTGGSSVADTVKTLQDQGFNVQLNGARPDVPVSECTVTDIHGLRDSNVDASGQKIDPRQLTIVYVDISCPSND